MLTIKTDCLNLENIHDIAEHYYGKNDGAVLVKETRKEPFPVKNGMYIFGSFYCYFWTGKALRKAEDIEFYVFKNTIHNSLQS